MDYLDDTDIELILLAMCVQIWIYSMQALQAIEEVLEAQRHERILVILAEMAAD